MFCPQCGTENPAEAAFCGNCGTRLAAGQQPPAAPPAPASAPYAPPPPPPPPPPGFSAAPPSPGYAPPSPDPGPAPSYAPPAPGYAPPSPGYAPAPQGYAPAPPGYSPPPPGFGHPGTVPPLPGRRPTGPEGSRGALIVGMVAGAVAVLALIAGGVFLLLGGGGEDEDELMTSTISLPELTASSTTLPGETTVTPPTDPVTPGAGGGYATPEEAVKAEAPEGWVYQLVDDYDGRMEFWSGPPQSEWVTAYLAEEGPDGTWTIVDAWDIGGSDVAATPAEEAEYLVEEFLLAVMFDDPEYAQSLTVEPFSLDPASAQYSNGDFLSYDVVEVQPQSDGTFWVKVEEEWRWGRERWRYWVVPTKLGPRIAELRDW